MYSQSIVDVYWSMPVLVRLLNFDLLKNFYKLKFGTSHIPDEYSKGYSFTLAFAISSIIDHVSDDSSCSYVLDLPHDELLRRASYGYIPNRKKPAYTRTGILIRNLTELYTPLLRVETWNDLDKASGDIKKYIIAPFNKAFDETISVTDKYKNLNKRYLLEYSSLFMAHLYFHDITKISIGYRSTYNNRGPPEYTIGSQKFFEGYKLSVEYLWFSFLGPSYAKCKSLSKIQKTKTWGVFDHLFEPINFAILKPLEARTGINSLVSDIFFKEVTLRRFPIARKLIFERQIQKTQEERLAEKLRWYPIQIIDDYYENSRTGFETVLKGALHKNQKPDVIKFIHPEERGNFFSFGILTEDSFGWWLFFNFATDFSGGGSIDYEHVMMLINRNKRKINFSNFEIDSSSLKRYAEVDTRINYLEKELKDSKEKLNEVRGKNFELFVTLLFSKRDFNVFPRVKFHGREIDMLAIQSTKGRDKIFCIECTIPFGANVRNKLELEVKEKIVLLKENLQELEGKLNLKLKNPIFDGRIVTLSNCHFKNDGIKIIDFKILKGLCKRYNVHIDSFISIDKRNKLRNFKIGKAEEITISQKYD